MQSSDSFKSASVQASVMPAFSWTLLLAAGLMAFVAWDQSHWWSAKEDYSFGWFVPVVVAYVIYDRWPRLVAVMQSLGASSEFSGVLARKKTTGLLQLFAVLMLIAGGSLFFIGAIYRAASGPSFAGTLAITLGMAPTLLAMIFLTAPTDARFADNLKKRWVTTSLFFFPALVWLVSAPMITAVENNLNVFLMGKVTTIVFFVFDLLGLPLEQQGNVLLLPTGAVGVAEACSGIRSLTACLFVGLLLSAVFVRSPWKKAVLIVSSLLLAFGTNLLRSLFLTAWSYCYGSASIEGTVHDVAGYAVLALTALGLLCLLPFLEPRRTKGQHQTAPNPQAHDANETCDSGVI